MSIIGKVVPLILGLSLVGGVGAYSANAMSITLDDTAPNSGSVTLDDNDDVVSASSPILYNLAKNAESNATGTSKYQLKTAYHWRYSDWVVYSDHHNYINGYKQGHSNYLHHKVRHGSFATVGGSGDGWRYASAQKWSYASGAGKGTFVAKFDAPYK